MQLSIIDVLIDRDGMDREEAVAALNQAANLVYLGRRDPVEILREEFGLEEDYLDDLISWV